MLYLIGVGLWDEKDISLRGLEIAKKCDRVFIEKYTGFWEGNLKSIGINAEEVERKNLENNISEFLEEAKDKNVALLVPGDPLIATTHVSIMMDAKEKNIEVKIIHSSSIFSALGETGLQIYKFGKIATIPYYYSETPYKILKENIGQGSHTLFLLDITKEKLMTGGEGLKILLNLEEKFQKGLISRETKAIVFCRVGGKEQVLKYDKIENLLNIACFPCVIIIPGKLHFLEEDYLSSLKN